MKRIRIVRIILAILFFACSILFFVFGHEYSVAHYATRLQILPLYLAESAGVILVWLIITFLWGRIYCSTVCPVGTLQDIAIRLRRCWPRFNKPFAYKTPWRGRMHILVIYLICMICGFTIVSLILEPWYIFGNITSAAGAKGMHQMWIEYGFSAVLGIIIGIISLLILLPYALLRGRDFCNNICPFGTVLSIVASRAALQIVIDPDKCISCMRCEDECRSSCIKVVSRHVDNSRCIRCFDCIAHCPVNAIKYTQQKHRPMTPLFSKVSRHPNA